MLTALWCWFFGHKTIAKVYSPAGKTFPAIDRLTGNPVEGHYYTLRRMDHCLRCEKFIPLEPGEQPIVDPLGQLKGKAGD
jgi:hypothetical protein